MRTVSKKKINPSLRKGKKKPFSANTKEPVLSKDLQEEFIHFLTHCPVKRFNRNLRNMLLEFLLVSGGEAPYLKDLVIDLESLFYLLDAAEEEWGSENSTL